MDDAPPIVTTLSDAVDDRFRLLVESVHDYGIIMLDPAGNIFSWNPGGVIALAEGRFEEEGVRLRKGGAPFWAIVTTTNIHDSFGRHIGFANVNRGKQQCL